MLLVYIIVVKVKLKNQSITSLSTKKINDVIYVYIRLNNGRDTIMAKFEKGNKLGGRKPGSLNRSTEMAKLTLARLANTGLNNITEDLEKIRKKDPAQAAQIYLKLLEFVVPKLKSVEMKVDAEVNHKVEQIKVEIVQKQIEIDATEYKD